MGEDVETPRKRAKRRLGLLNTPGRVASALGRIAREMYAEEMDAHRGHRVATVLNHLRHALADQALEQIQERLNDIESKVGRPDRRYVR
jgi:hypothetical protein